MVKRCLGALEEPPVVEALSFLDLTERDRFMVQCYRGLKEFGGTLSTIHSNS